MKPRVVVLTVVASMVLAGLLVAAGWMLVAEPFKQRRRLPNGAMFTLEAVSYGTKHHFNGEKWWTRYLPFPPKPGTAVPRRGRRGASHSTPRDMLVAWVRLEVSARQRMRYHPYAMDEHGCRFPSPRLFIGDMSPVPAGGRDLVVGYELPVFPRRGSSVQFGHLGLASAPLVRFTVANPERGPHPTWAAEPYPIVKQAGDLAVILDGLLHQPYQSGRVPSSRARLRLLRAGAPARGWEPVAVTVSDATGNVTMEGVRGDPRGVSFHPLCKQEAAWKLRVTLAPTGSERALWSWTAPDIPVGPPARARAVGSSVHRAGVTLFVEYLYPTRPRGTPGGKTRGVMLRVRLLAPGKDVWPRLVRAVDERGRTVKVSGPSTWFMPRPAAVAPADQWHSFSLQFPADAKKLRLTFGVSQTRTVEFLAKP